jgi:hypothetical protein
MPSIDDRIVSMKFDNSSFESKVRNTIGVLQTLKSTLNFVGASKGLDNVQTSADNMDLTGISLAVDVIADKFTNLGIVGVTALASIANRAVQAGLSLVKSLSFGPIIAGYKEYETNIQSIQTILANTSSKGTTLEDVNRALDELNTYSDQTIYNFGEMVRNIGTFTAAGVDLETAVASIKCIANH